MTHPLDAALALPNGSRLYRCALQVNPYAYLATNAKATTFASEDDYNQAMVAACKRNGIEIIGVTDHYRVHESVKLVEAARQAGIHVFPGFEAVTKDRVHVLCLFPPNREIASLVSYIGDCGVHGESATSALGKHDFVELLDAAKGWGALCIAAHATTNGGLLWQLDRQPRVHAWTNKNLLAASIPGTASEVPEAGIRQILENKNAEYKRDRPVALINAQDVNGPDDLEKPGATCLIKMSEVSLEGLRQAFLDPMSRIRLNSEPPAAPHSELVAMTWEGGRFLDGASIHFNENLNVLIGGRGAGKSTVVESIRYVLGLDPIGDGARAAHESIVRHVLRAGTKVSMRVQTYRPKKLQYTIERTVPNPPVVRDADGQVVPLTPADVMPRAEVYGQHEISELAKSQEKLTRLLERFAQRDPVVAKRKHEVVQELRKSRLRTLELDGEVAAVHERLDSLPGLEQTLRAYQDAGLEERLKERSVLLREERVLDTAAERLAPLETAFADLRQLLPIDRAFLSPKALEDLPGKETLRKVDDVLTKADADLSESIRGFHTALQRAGSGVAVVRAEWDERKRAVLSRFEKILRELQQSKVDGEEFIRIRRQIEELRPLKERQAALARDAKENAERRRNLLAEWEDLKTAEFLELDRATREIRRWSEKRVEVVVTSGRNRERLRKLLVDKIGGRLSEVLDVLDAREDLSLPELAASMRSGRDALVQKFALTASQADRLAQAPPEVSMLVEELELLPTTTISLNVAAENEVADYRPLDQLSTGQKATAVLLLLLLDSDAPLIVDQPEDDLDNRFVTDGVVPRIAAQKRRRQFVFATHNANVPVLGDAELIVGLTAKGEAGGDEPQGKVTVDPKYMASIDSEPVRRLVEDLLEGGKAAFEMRRLKYDF